MRGLDHTPLYDGEMRSNTTPCTRLTHNNVRDRTLSSAIHQGLPSEMGSISLREYIRWLPGEPEEPTSTVVVTSPKRHFVDIRVLRSDTSTGDAHPGLSIHISNRAAATKAERNTRQLVLT